MPYIPATATQLHEVFHYDPDTGEIRWTDFFMIPVRNHNKVATKQYGEFLSINFLNQTVRAHHLAWCLQTGNWPRKQVIHLNGDSTDNRWINLAYRTSLNTPVVHKLPESGIKGVYCHKDTRRKPWFAMHTPRDASGAAIADRRCLGHYQTREEAAEALRVVQAEEELNNAVAGADPKVNVTLDNPEW